METKLKDHVYLAMPMYGRTPDFGASQSYFSYRGHHEEFDVSLGSSSGGCTHNNLWVAAMNGRQEKGLNLLAMIHSDVEPLVHNWLHVFYDIMQEHDADLVSAVIPQKNFLGLTLTGLMMLDERRRTDLTLEDIAHLDETPRQVRRLTMREIMEMPETFTVADIVDQSKEPKPVALVSGLALMLCRLDREWCKSAQLGCNMKIYYDPETGQAASHFESEDWYFSEHIHRAGGKIVVTREVPCKHHGDVGFPNNQAWGQWSHDRGIGRENRDEDRGRFTLKPAKVADPPTVQASSQRVTKEARECEACGCATTHIIHDAGEERNSSNNWQKCLVCGKMTTGVL